MLSAHLKYVIVAELKSDLMTTDEENRNDF